jgi:hypothetical protein
MQATPFNGVLTSTLQHYDIISEIFTSTILEILSYNILGELKVEICKSKRNTKVLSLKYDYTTTVTVI